MHYGNVGMLKRRKDNMKKKIAVTMISFLLAIPVGASSQDVFIYPTKGQSAEQQDKDKFECASWAKQQTGFDPMQTPKTSTPPPQQQEPQAGLVKGAARGALVGTAVGAIAGNTGKGAAIGAAAGGLAGGMKRRDQEIQQKNAESQWAQNESAKYAQAKSDYNRAYSVCLEGKGYTVK